MSGLNELWTHNGVKSKHWWSYSKDSKNINCRLCGMAGPSLDELTYHDLDLHFIEGLTSGMLLLHKLEKE